jgi:hypothetical protein
MSLIRPDFDRHCRSSLRHMPWVDPGDQVAELVHIVAAGKRCEEIGVRAELLDHLDRYRKPVAIRDDVNSVWSEPERDPTFVGRRQRGDCVAGC